MSLRLFASLLLLGLLNSTASAHCSHAMPNPNITCGVKGTLSKPDLLETVAKAKSVDQCAAACSSLSKCEVMSFVKTGSVCRLYGKTLPKMGFKKSSRSNMAFYNKNCFKCKSPTTTSSSSAASSSSSTTTTAATSSSPCTSASPSPTFLLEVASGEDVGSYAYVAAPPNEDGFYHTQITQNVSEAAVWALDGCLGGALAYVGGDEFLAYAHFDGSLVAVTTEATAEYYGGELLTCAIATFPGPVVCDEGGGLSYFSYEYPVLAIGYSGAPGQLTFDAVEPLY